MDKLKECFNNAIKDENKGKKHKGLLKVKVDSNKILNTYTFSLAYAPGTFKRQN